MTPALTSRRIPADVRRRIQATVDAISAMPSAREIVAFYWSAIRTSRDLPRRMKQGGVPQFEAVMVEFRDRFNEEWLAAEAPDGAEAEGTAHRSCLPPLRGGTALGGTLGPREPEGRGPGAANARGEVREGMIADGRPADP